MSILNKSVDGGVAKLKEKEKNKRKSHHYDNSYAMNSNRMLNVH